MVKLLLAPKAGFSAKFPGSGATPIQCAVNFKRHDVWPLLRKHEADYSDIGIANGGSMLHFPAAQGTDEGIRAFLRKSPDASAVDKYGRSAFHVAAGNGQLQSLKATV